MIANVTNMVHLNHTSDGEDTFVVIADELHSDYERAKICGLGFYAERFIINTIKSKVCELGFEQAGYILIVDVVDYPIITCTTYSINDDLIDIERMLVVYNLDELPKFEANTQLAFLTVNFLTSAKWVKILRL